jgi:hypothetical protein
MGPLLHRQLLVTGGSELGQAKRADLILWHADGLLGHFVQPDLSQPTKLEKPLLGSTDARGCPGHRDEKRSVVDHTVDLRAGCLDPGWFRPCQRERRPPSRQSTGGTAVTVDPAAILATEP